MFKLLFLVCFISLSSFSQSHKFSTYLQSVTLKPLTECSFLNGKYSKDKYASNVDFDIYCQKNSAYCQILFSNGRKVSTLTSKDQNGVSLNISCIKDNSIYTKLLFTETSPFNTYIQSLHIESNTSTNDVMLVLQDLQQQKSFLFFKVSK
ncbi:MAG: hypothetical protein L6Q37_10780 [Bdellovibrionaceae bacterium]|nr:hypothetical protein [Pseudobdellovibrionaceae bacterium]NUM58671.1 hypothetical protein [Pseudobdellovibrionaceae bacterium]